MINKQLCTDEWSTIGQFLEIRDTFTLLKVNHASRKAIIEKLKPLANTIIQTGFDFETHLQNLNNYTNKRKYEMYEMGFGRYENTLLIVIYLIVTLALIYLGAGLLKSLAAGTIGYVTCKLEKGSTEEKFISPEDNMIIQNKIISLKKPSYELMIFFDELFKPFGGFTSFSKNNTLVHSFKLQVEPGLWSDERKSKFSKPIHFLMFGRIFGFVLQTRKKYDFDESNKKTEYFMNTGKDLFTWERYTLFSENISFTDKEAITNKVDPRMLSEIKQLVDGTHRTRELCN